MAKVLRKCAKYITVDLSVSAFSPNIRKFHSNYRISSPINTSPLLRTLNENFHLNSSSLSNIDSTMKCPFQSSTSFRNFRTRGPLLSYKRTKNDRANLIASAVPRGEGNEGEDASSLDLAMDPIRGFGDIFPDENTNNLLFEGTRFADLPIVHVKVSRNNTIMDLADAKGYIMFKRSCGTEGFKNAKKGTNIAAQATAITLGTKAVLQGIKNVRVKVNGLGPGRMAAMKGLIMGGLNVISISDVTPIPFNFYPRPRKAKKK